MTMTTHAWTRFTLEDFRHLILIVGCMFCRNEKNGSGLTTSSKKSKHAAIQSQSSPGTTYLIFVLTSRTFSTRVSIAPVPGALSAGSPALKRANARGRFQPAPSSER